MATINAINNQVTDNNFRIPNTNTAGTSGEIVVGGNRFVSNFGTSNTFIGSGSGNSTLSGGSNTSIGTNSLTSATSGTSNTAIGASSLTAVTSGNNNTGIGSSALMSVISTDQSTGVGGSVLFNSTGARNSGFGYQAGSALTTGTDNLAVGYQAGQSWTTSESNNIAIGNTGIATDANIIRIGTFGSGTRQQNQCYIAACYSNFGTQNTFVGVNAGNTTLTTAQQNVGVGTNALLAVTTGVDNVAIGVQALQALTTGGSNIGIGRGAVANNLTSGSNIGIGHLSLVHATSSSNIAIGTTALTDLTTGADNIGIGAATFFNLTTGSNNIGMGIPAGINYSGSESNNIIISHSGILGDNHTTRIGTYGSSSSQQNKCYIAACYSNFGTNNTFVGELPGNTTLTIAEGIQNVAVGSQALQSIVGGQDNIAIGYNALQLQQDGGQNIAIGTDTLTTTTNSNDCIAIGDAVLTSCTSGSDNIGMGESSLHTLNTGQQNVAIGLQSLELITTGSRNTAIGVGAGSGYASSESDNLVVGTNDGIVGDNHTIRIGTYGTGNFQQNKCYIAACYSNFGTDNTFVGEQAGNTTITGFSNTSTGFQALTSISSGLANTAIGNTAGSNITTGSENVALGSGAGVNITTGGSNIAIGSTAIRKLTTGGNNIAVGVLAGDSYTSSESQNIVIANAGVVGESFTIRIGSDTNQNKCFISAIRGKTTVNNDAIAVLIDSAGQLGTVSSTRRVKENIQPMGSDSNALMQLQPVTFNYISDQTKKKQYGLIAEQVAQVFPDLVVYDKDGQPETIKYHDLPAILLNELKNQRNAIALLLEEVKLLKQMR